MRIRLSLVPLVPPVLLVLALGCRNPDPIQPPPETPCASDAECPTGQLCGGGACRPRTVCPATPCASSETCKDGICVRPSSTCADVKCAAGEVCVDAKCHPMDSACFDGRHNGDETGVDCGGSCPQKCGDGAACSSARDCTSGVCSGSVCARASCTDAMRNGTETDVDCGSACPKRCADGKRCAAASDCESGVCTGSLCTAPACADGIQNGGETGTDCGGTCPKCLPPDPAKVAPPLDPAKPSGLLERVGFLFSGPDPVQRGLDPKVLVPERTCVLRGAVRTADDRPLPGAKITILGHPELGSTESRKDGQYDLVVNGGGDLVVEVSLAGHIGVQRRVAAPWGDFAAVPPTVLLPYDAKVTEVTSNSATLQVATGGPVQDLDGKRQAVVMFVPGTQAGMELSAGQSRALPAFHVRATEYTVGSAGEKAMPGPLPSTSAFTYAVELSVDEAVQASATSVTFSKPAAIHLDNFLGFPAGASVPTGYYDRSKAQWIPSASGVVIKILNKAQGLAELDVDGSGKAAGASALSALKISDEERKELATRYATGLTLWRALIPHFTAWDLNWAFGPPKDAVPPTQPRPTNVPCPCGGVAAGSIINCANQSVSQRVGLTGAPALHYASDRVPGRQAAASLHIPLIGEAVPPGVTGVELEVQVAGRVFSEHFAPQAKLSTTFTWDGKDAYGRALPGRQPATVRTGYTYPGSYQQTDRFGYNGNGTPITGSRTRREVTLWQEQRTNVGVFDAKAVLKLGGWSFGVQHAYDPGSRTLFLGTGEERSAETVNGVISTIAGTGPVCRDVACGEGKKAKEVSIGKPGELVVAPDGTITLLAHVGRTRLTRIDPTGVLTNLATSEKQLPYADNMPLADVDFFEARSLTMGPDGGLYFAQASTGRVRKIGRDGIVRTIAGNGQKVSSGDGGPATAAGIFEPHSVAVSRDGTVYIGDRSHRIRRVSPDGIIDTVVGNGVQGGFTYSCPRGIGQPARTVPIYVKSNHHLAVAPDGTLFFESGDHLYKVGADGLLQAAIAGCKLDLGDGLPAGSWVNTDAGGLSSMAFAPDGRLFFGMTHSYGRQVLVRELTADGILRNLTSIGFGTTGDSGPSGAATTATPAGLAMAPDGSLLLSASSYNHDDERIRRVSTALTGYRSTDIVIPSEDGSAYYVLDLHGRHLSTVSTLDGVVRLKLGYDAAGALTSLTDADGNATSVERDAKGTPTAIVGEDGQRNVLTVDKNGYLASIANPAGEKVTLAYADSGLMTSFLEPLGCAHTYVYDPAGRLLAATDAESKAQSLSRVDAVGDSGMDFTVTRKTPLGVTQSWTSKLLSNLARRVSAIRFDGKEATVSIDRAGRTTSLLPSGLSIATATGAHPVFEGALPFVVSQTVKTPGGLTLKSDLSLSVTPGPTKDPLQFDRIEGTVKENARSHRFSYDRLTSLYESVSAEGRKQDLLFDRKGHVTSARPPGMVPIAYEYDLRGRPLRTRAGTGPDERVIELRYGKDGNVEGIKNALGQERTFLYDAAGRVTQSTFDGKKVKLAYDANGNLTGVTPPGKAAHGFRYTRTNHMTEYTPPVVGGAAAPVRLAYDADQRLSTYTRADGTTLDYSYDADGRVKAIAHGGTALAFAFVPGTEQIASVTAPSRQKTAYTYDGPLRTEIAASGSTAGKIGLTYDSDLRLSALSLNGTEIAKRSYDKDGLLTQAGAMTFTRDPASGRVTRTILGDVTEDFTYNAFGELASQSAMYKTTEIFKRVYGRDKLARIVKVQETEQGVSRTLEYGYDSSGRLSGVTENGKGVASYAYDENGNRTTAVVDARDRLVSEGGATFTHSPDGEIITRADAGGTTAYKYSPWGMSEVALPGGKKIEYVLDGGGARVQKKVNGAPEQGFLFLDALRPLAELDAAAKVKSTFFYGRRINVPEYLTRDGDTYRVLTDHLGSPRLVVNIATGQVTQRMEYDAFGKVVADTKPGFQPFGFAGGQFDHETGLVQFGLRHYDARTGRWMNRDGLLFFGGDSNLYAYVRNDPVNYTDPLGTDSHSRDLEITGGGELDAETRLREAVAAYAHAKKALGENDPTVRALKEKIAELAILAMESKPCEGHENPGQGPPGGSTPATGDSYTYYSPGNPYPAILYRNRRYAWEGPAGMFPTELSDPVRAEELWRRVFQHGQQ